MAIVPYLQSPCSFYLYACEYTTLQRVVGITSLTNSLHDRFANSRPPISPCFSISNTPLKTSSLVTSTELWPTPARSPLKPPQPALTPPALAPKPSHSPPTPILPRSSRLDSLYHPSQIPRSLYLTTFTAMLMLGRWISPGGGGRSITVEWVGGQSTT